MATILTLDLGTTYFKVCLFDERGRMLAAHGVAPPIVRGPCRWELPVPAFQATVTKAVRRVLAAAPRAAGRVAAVSFATQTNSFVLLDRREQPLTPLVLWPDARVLPGPDLDTMLGRLDAHRAATGVPALSPQFMVGKLWWLRKNQPGLWRRVRRVCLISDYLGLWLTGEPVAEGGAAGLTALCDGRTLRWIPEACAEVGVDPAWLPRLARAGTLAGPIRSAAAAELGLPARCPFVVGCLDQYAGAIGVGNVAPGGCSETTGTVLAVVQCADRFGRTRRAVFRGPGWAGDRVYRMTFGSHSANLLEWYRGRLPDRPSFAELDALASAVAPGAGGLRIREGAHGEPVFAGATPAHTRGHHARCVLERVALALREHVAALCGDAWPREIRCAGGGARSALWLQIKADLLGVPMVATACDEPTSLGAAMLAARALGRGDLDALAGRWVRMRARLVPDRRRHARYRALFPHAGG